MTEIYSIIPDMPTLLGVVKALVDMSDLTPVERAAMADAAPRLDPAYVESVSRAIGRGEDPLGLAYRQIRGCSLRRKEGITLTPSAVVDSIIQLAVRCKVPRRVVDPGAGTGRFALAAARQFPQCQVVAVERNPVLALILRANLATLTQPGRVELVVGDYRDLVLSSIDGPTLFVGNPPYVRHHDIDATWKRWYASAFASLGIAASGLAGLHIHFFLKTLLLASRGDYGCFITAAEWLDVGYGDALRRLLTQHLGCSAIYLIDKRVPVFDDALTSAAVTCFEVGSAPEAIDFYPTGVTGGRLTPGPARSASLGRVQVTRRWSELVQTAPIRHTGMIELGEYFRVQRGQVTGMNEVWIAGQHAAGLPETVLIPTVTKARELIALPGNRLDCDAFLRRVIDLPSDLSVLTSDMRERVEAFLAWARERGADQSYIARHRSPWWRVNLRFPAPVLMTYMGRRPPVFRLNTCGARHINIAHGLYPREAFADDDLARLVSWLNGNVAVACGRTYAGGLTKFEPGEAMRLPIPTFDQLREIGREAA